MTAISTVSNTSITHSFTIDQELNASETKIIDLIWAGNIEETNACLAITPSLIGTKFKLNFWNFNEIYHIDHCSLLHLACFAEKEQVVKIFAPHHDRLIRFEGIEQRPLPLEVVVDFIEDTIGYSLAYNLLSTAITIEEQVRMIIPLAVINEKPLTLEGCFKSMCQNEFESLNIFIANQFSQLAPCFKIIAEYAGYILNSKITKAVNHEEVSDENELRRYHTPLDKALEILKEPSSSLKTVEVARLLLSSGGNLKVRYSESEIPRRFISTNIKTTSILEKYQESFPDGYFDRLLDDRINSQTLLNELINFRTNSSVSLPKERGVKKITVDSYRTITIGPAKKTTIEPAKRPASRVCIIQ